MFKKYPECKPEENQKVIAIHNENTYNTQYATYNERVPQEELPDGIIHAIRKSKNNWFLDVQLKPEDLEKIPEIEVWWTPFPEEACLKKEDQIPVEY